MTLAQDIADWAATRPWWQQRLLTAIAAGRPLEQSEIEAMADALIASKELEFTPLAAKDVPGQQVGGDSVKVEAISELENINALSDDAEISVGVEGLTIVYGDNAAGKSGFARLVKEVSGARHHEPILSNVFARADAGTQQAATISYRVGDTQKSIRWPDDPAADLRRVHFYDSACGDAYLSTESELTYRPSALSLLDRLVQASDAVRDELNRRVEANNKQAKVLPQVAEGTPGATLLANLSASTKPEEVETAGKAPDDVDDQIAALIQEEARLKASNPEDERKRMTAVAGALELLATQMQRVHEALGPASVKELLELSKKTRELRSAATVASADNFKAEPLDGVGSATWRNLWEAARAYSTSEAYCDHDFPVTDEGARCVLCQQELSGDAPDRLRRFEAFMRDTTEAQAAEAERRLASDVGSIERLTPSSGEVARALSRVEANHGELARRANEWFDSAATTREKLLEVLADQTSADVPDVLDSIETELRQAATALRTEASSIDDTKFRAQLGEARSKREDLESQRTIAQQASTIKGEIERLKERAKIESAKQGTDTSAITRKGSDLTRQHVTEAVRDRFTRETDRLRLERITLADVGGQKGRLRHKPQLVGAERAAAVAEVLSEGEQTALGVAGLFTEAHFDASKSAIVLDDPVTSLDHVRRPRVAKRLAEYAKERQVVVFTHDISFVGELAKAAEAEGVPVTERAIERRGNTPGIAVDKHPWKAKDVKKRLGDLEASLAKIKREKSAWDQEKYEKECADWAGKLSETWERIINLEVVNQVVDRATLEVQPKKFRLLVCIDEKDDREFQASYGRCSTWLRRHDKSPEKNYVPPEVDEMEEELKLVRTWFDRVRKYI